MTTKARVILVAALLYLWFDACLAVSLLVSGALRASLPAALIAFGVWALVIWLAVRYIPWDRTPPTARGISFVLQLLLACAVTGLATGTLIADVITHRVSPEWIRWVTQAGLMLLAFVQGTRYLATPKSQPNAQFTRFVGWFSIGASAVIAILLGLMLWGHG